MFKKKWTGEIQQAALFQFKIKSKHISNNFKYVYMKFGCVKFTWQQASTHSCTYLWGQCDIDSHSMLPCSAYGMEGVVYGKCMGRVWDEHGKSIGRV